MTYMCGIELTTGECTTPDINPSNVCTHLSACLARATPKANSFAYQRCRDNAAVKMQPATERAMQMYLAVATMRQGQPFENTRHMSWNVHISKTGHACGMMPMGLYAHGRSKVVEAVQQDRVQKDSQDSSDVGARRGHVPTSILGAQSNVQAPALGPVGAQENTASPGLATSLDTKC